MSFGDRKSTARWTSLGDIGSEWRLISFSERQPPSWERYWSEHREYWAVDDPEGRKTRLWFWETFTEESFLAKARLQYANYVEYLKHWSGLCKVGEVIAVIPVSPTTVVLSRNWSGSISDHSDLEVVLYQTYRTFLIPAGFECSIYSYGTITVLPGSMEAQMGERVGSSRIRHDRGGFTRAQNRGMAFNPSEGCVKIWDALFEIQYP
jgi:hypothetical protein